MVTDPSERKNYRHFRPIVVPEKLSDLDSTITGIVELPLILNWQPNKTYNLDDEYFERRYYQTVIMESLSPEIMAKYLNGQRLIELWPSMWLAPYIREVWESKFPELPPSNGIPRPAGGPLFG